MTKARDIADGGQTINTSNFVTKDANGIIEALDGSALTNLTSGNLNGNLPALDGSSLTGIDAGLNSKIVTGTYSSTNQTAFTISSIGFEPKHVICRFQLNSSAVNEATHNMSFGNATKINETTSEYVCAYDYYRQSGAEAYEPVTSCMGRLAYGGAKFNEIKVSNWGTDSLELTPVSIGAHPTVDLRYQLIIQG